MSLNIGQKNQIKEIKEKDENQLKTELRKECLVIALIMIRDGETRKADEAIRVYKTLVNEKD